MASLQASNLGLFSSYSSSSCRRNINAALTVPKLPRNRFSVQRTPTKTLVEELNLKDGVGYGLTNTPVDKTSYEFDILTSTNEAVNNFSTANAVSTATTSTSATAKLYAILEAVDDRIQMHKNIGEQRDNWNTLLLNSVNMITLTAATMTGIAATAGAHPILALKLSSTLLFSAATGMLVIMNKIQPSQLAEEQRNATRLFRQLFTKIQTTLALGHPTELDVEEFMEQVLSLDQAYPLPLLGKMIEKFPAKFEPAVWWPKSSQSKSKIPVRRNGNGWDEGLEMEMREVLEVVKQKDREDYMRLGNLALKINKALAIAGPLLAGIAAAGSAIASQESSWAAVVGVAAGALSCVVNTLEHGGQVGMVIEMYRNCAGFFSLLEDTVETTLGEKDIERREDGEIFKMKMALQLGRSLSDLKDFANKSSTSRTLQGTTIDEFASKLF